MKSKAFLCTANREISNSAMTTHEADMRCCGTHADWNSQPANPVAYSSMPSSRRAPRRAHTTKRRDPVAAKSTAHSAAERPPNHTARPIIKVREEKAENQVSAMSASHPVNPSMMANWAALKCQR